MKKSTHPHDIYSGAEICFLGSALAQTQKQQIKHQMDLLGILFLPCRHTNSFIVSQEKSGPWCLGNPAFDTTTLLIFVQDRENNVGDRHVKSRTRNLYRNFCFVLWWPGESGRVGWIETWEISMESFSKEVKYKKNEFSKRGTVFCSRYITANRYITASRYVTANRYGRYSYYVTA